MTAIKIPSFSGELPKVDPRLLPEDFAAYAVNVNLQSGILKGVNEPQLVQDLGTIVTIVRKVFRLDNNGEDFWFGLSDPDADLLKAPLVNDLYERYYWTRHDTRPAYNTLLRMMALQPPWTLGIPTPTFAPTLDVTGGGTEYSETTTRAYVFTYVSAYGEEGPPSPPISASGFDDGDLDLAAMNQTIPNSANLNLDRIRIYRTITALTGDTLFYQVAELPLGTDTYTDTSLDSEVVLNDTLLSTSWTQPPVGLQGIVAMAGGFLAGFVGRDLYFSEPYRPHAWPAEYVLSVEWPIVGLGVFGNTLIIMTEGMPHACTGIRPDSMSLEKIDTPEPCLSKGSIISAPEGVYYAGPNGLILVDGSGPHNVLKDVVDKKTWNERFHPSTLRAARHKVGYIALTGTGEGFIVELGESRTAFIEFTSMAGAQSIQNDYRSGDVYLVARNNVYRWDPDVEPRTTGLWRSKEFHFPKPVNLGAMVLKLDLSDSPAQPDVGYQLSPTSLIGDPPAVPPSSTVSAPTVLPIVPEGQHVRVKVWADRRLVYDQFINDNRQRRLPAGFKADIWQVELAVRRGVYSIMLAETPRELASV